jgi:ABC-type methionine transport system ATPase subunit
MVELTIPKNYKDEPVIYQLIKRFKVIPTIIEASFSTDNGWAYIKIEGEENEIKKAFEFLRSKNIIVDTRL